MRFLGPRLQFCHHSLSPLQQQQPLQQPQPQQPLPQLPVLLPLCLLLTTRLHPPQVPLLHPAPLQPLLLVLVLVLVIVVFLLIPPLDLARGSPTLARMKVKPHRLRGSRRRQPVRLEEGQWGRS